MSRALTKAGKCVAIGGALLLGFGFVCYVSGARVNTTESLPLGLYWTTHEPIEKGAYVMFCPPNQPLFDVAKHRGYIGAGFCDGGYGYMMKRILAAKGDTITVDAKGVAVNGAMLAHSMPLTSDDSGRMLPRYTVQSLQLGANDLLLMSDICDESFDARYFGPIARAQVKWVIRPIITW